MDQNNEQKARKEVLVTVYNALVEKGADPFYALAGYLISDDPTYITEHKNARSLIRLYSYEEYLEDMVREDLLTEPDGELREAVRLAHDGALDRKKSHDRAVYEIVGYLVTGDPTYIAPNLGARSRIMQYERDEIICQLVKDYLEEE